MTAACERFGALRVMRACRAHGFFALFILIFSIAGVSGSDAVSSAGSTRSSLPIARRLSVLRLRQCVDALDVLDDDHFSFFPKPDLAPFGSSLIRKIVPICDRCVSEFLRGSR